MMVTACSDDQEAACPKAKDLSPILRTLEAKGGLLKEKVGAYMTLSERLKNDKDASLSHEISQHTVELTCIVGVDVMNDDAELNQAALQALGFCLHLPDISRAFSPDDASTVVKALCSALLKTADKSTCTRALWCLSKQTFAQEIVRKEIHTILCAVEHALVQGDFQSMTVEYEALNVIIRLLESLPDDMTTHAARWGKLLFPLVIRPAPKIRERAACALHLGLQPMLQHQSEIVPGLVTDLKTTLVPEMMKLFASKCEIQVLKMWGNFVTLLGKALHKGGGLINCLLGVVEQGFKHASSDVKLASFVAWKVLIDNFAIEPDVLYNVKRLKLLLQPLRATSAKQEMVAQAKLDTWWYLVSQLGPKAAMNFDQVCAPLLQFVLGLNTNTNGAQCPSTPLAANGSGLRQGFTTPLHRPGSRFTMPSPATPRLNLPPGTPGGTAPSVFKSIQLQGVELLARVLGMPSDAVGVVPSYSFTINALSHPMILSSTAFIKFSVTLVPMVRDVICNLGDQLDDGLLFHLWYSLVSHVSDMVTTATKKDSVEVFTQFLSSVQCIVGASRLSSKTLLKMLEAVSRLPKNVLGSPSYHASNAGLMHGTPALFLIELLLCRGLMATAVEERFFCVLETFIDCGLTVPRTVLGFSGSVLQLVDKAAADVSNKSIIWRIWSCIVYPLLGHIIETTEVNQGDSLDHDFSTMYSSLMLPVHHLLPSDSLPQMTVKTVHKTWSELYRAFARGAAVVTTADSNLGCEELCTKILATLDKQPMTLSYVESLAQIMQVIANSMDFSSFNASASLNNPLTPGRGGRARIRPLGNMTSFVRLLVRVIGEIKNRVKTENSKLAGLQSSNSCVSSPCIGTIASILSTLVTNVSHPSILEALVDKLADPVSSFYDNTGAFKSGAYPAPTWQKLEKLWTDFLTSVQTRYGGPYNSAFLAMMSPLLESGFTHPKRSIKSHVLVFWNATFATVESLDYPESLKVCLAKLKEKTSLVLPGWTDVELQVVNETPVSQLTENEPSQSLIPPPPAVSTIPNFGAPSPQKMHGSFLKRTAQAERLVVSSSPERYKNNSPFGKISKRSVSPGKGVLRGLTSPVGGKGKRDGSPVVSGAAARRRLHVDEESVGEFVFIAPSPKKSQILTDHQKEMLRTRRVLPALYNDLEQSQDTQTFKETLSQTEATQESQEVEPASDPTASTTDESPSVFNFFKDQTNVPKKAPQEDSLVKIQSDALPGAPETAQVEEAHDKSKTEKAEPKKAETEKDEKADTSSGVSGDGDGKTLTFAGIFSKVKDCVDNAPAPSLEVVTTDHKDDDKSPESLPEQEMQLESSPQGSIDKPVDGGEVVAEKASSSPEKLSKDSIPNIPVASKDDKVKQDDIGVPQVESEIDGCIHEDVQMNEEEELKEETSGKDDQKILAKDSTDEEDGDVKNDIGASISMEEDFAIPETQQSESEKMVVEETDLMVSPTRVGSESHPTSLKLNLTPVIKLQKLNEADLVRLSPDPSKCSFSRLDINSSPKIFTSSEEEVTPNQFAARLRRLIPDETLKGVKKRNSFRSAISETSAENLRPERKQKRLSRAKGKRLGSKNLQSSQADLAELAERFELDGVQPLADETDMDQSMDLIDNDSQSKQVSQDAIGNSEKLSQTIPKKDHEENSDAPAKDKGKKESESTSDQDTISESFLSESYAADVSSTEDPTDTKLGTEQDSKCSHESGSNKEAAVKVPKKRGRKRKAKPTLSPVDEASSPLSLTEVQKSQPEGEKAINQGTSRKRRRQADTVPKLESQEEASETAPTEDTLLEKSNTTEPDSAKTDLGVIDSEKPDDLQNSEDQERQLNSLGDLFESCPKDIAEEEPTNTIQSETVKSVSQDKPVKRSQRIIKRKSALRIEKSQSFDCEEDSEEDNIPLAKIKNCYLDVDSQTSDSEVDFPKQTQESLTQESVKDVESKYDIHAEDHKAKKSPKIKTRRSRNKLPVKSSKISPNMSPKAACAKKILKRVKKSPHKSVNKNSSPARVTAKPKIAAKISPVATRLRTSKHLSSLSVSVPCKLTRKPRRVSKDIMNKDVNCKSSKKFTFEEKLEKAVHQDVVDDVFPDEFENLWEDLSPIAGLSTSLPLPDSKSLLSPSPVSFIEEDIHEKDIGTTNETAELPSVIPPAATDQNTDLNSVSQKIDLIIDPEAVEKEEILSSSFEGLEKVLDLNNEAMECSSFPVAKNGEEKSADCTDQEQNMAAESTPVDRSISEPPILLPQSPDISAKFAPSCHSSPNVSGAAKIRFTNQDSPSGSIPSMYSPAGSPSGGILKRKDSASPSPSTKSRRVSFAEPISEHSPVKRFAVELIPSDKASDNPNPSKVPRQAHPPSPLVTTTPSKVINVHSKFLTTPSRRSSGGGLGARSRVSPSGRRISPGMARKKSLKHQSFAAPSSGRKVKHVKPSSQGTPLTQSSSQQNSLDNSVDSDYDNQESVFPDLAECGTPVEKILPQLTSSMWSRGLGQLVRARNILTVGNLCSLSPSEIRSLPLRSPKIGNLRKVLTNFQKQQKSKDGTSSIKKQKDNGQQDAVKTDDGKSEVEEKVATESQKVVEEDAGNKQGSDVPATSVSSDLPSNEMASTSGSGPSQARQGTKRKRAEVESGNSDEALPSKAKQAKIVDKLENLLGEFKTEKLAELPSDRLFLAHQHVNNMMESIMAALKVKVKSPSLSS